MLGDTTGYLHNLDMSAAKELSAQPTTQPSQHDMANSNTSTANAVGDENGDSSKGQSKGQRIANKSKSNQICRFYSSKAGCRAGDTCRYQHVNISTTSTEPIIATSVSVQNSHDSTPSQHDDRDQSQRDIRRTQPRTSRRIPTVAKPVSRAQQSNPREFQISQVVRRFKPTREDQPDGTTSLSLNLVPSDPDFPFELAKLECKLTVPKDWPSGQTKPALQVENAEIPKGYQINIERGFGSLISPGKTLLALLNDLDRNLERFLASEKAQTIKIVANRRKAEPVAAEAIEIPASIPTEVPKISQPTWSHEQKALAKLKRENDIRQLEARMGRLPLFSASDDKIWFNVPINYAKPARLPISLQPLKEIALHVPLLYDLEPCSIKLKGVYGREADKVESQFAKYATDHHTSTLMAHVNYLTQHLHEMAVVSNEPVEEPVPIPQQTVMQDLQSSANHQIEVEGTRDQERPHLIFMSKPPPEWSRGPSDLEASSGSSSEDYTTSEDDESSADEGTTGGASIETPGATQPAVEKGILFSFPHLEMTGIEILEVRNLSLAVKCDRCKTIVEIKNIAASSAANPNTTTRTESCNKCANTLSAKYKSEMMHANSIKAGFIDLEGGTVQDMLPSQFTPTCSECSTTSDQPITSVRGDTSLHVCRTCHKKMTLTIAETKFLRVSSSTRITSGIKPKRKKENLGITSGTELPSRGSCEHYTKSYRWFRFSCCNRVYACDRCHDETEQHPNEHANRMICGWCSREQNYRPEDCHFCQRSVIRKTGGGFWEGGKGTRDRVKMNRNDPRKYKRIGGGSAGNK